MVLSPKRERSSLQVKGVTLPQPKELTYHGNLFTGDWKRRRLWYWPVDRVSGNRVTAVAGAQFADKALGLPVNLHPQAHLWLRAMGNDKKNHVINTGIRKEFLPQGLTLRILTIREGFRIEPLLFQIERSELRWFGQIRQWSLSLFPRMYHPAGFIYDQNLAHLF